jgi:Rrf2 family iron-sulfur cluster assembly transcriptional regulator
MTHDLWANLNKRMYEYLDSVTLAALVLRKVTPEKEVSRVKDGRRRAVIALHETAVA